MHALLFSVLLGHALYDTDTGPIQPPPPPSLLAFNQYPNSSQEFPNTVLGQCCLTLVMEWDLVLPIWPGHSCTNIKDNLHRNLDSLVSVPIRIRFSGKKQMVEVNFFLRSFFFWWFFFLGLKSIWLRLRSRSRLGFGFSLQKDTIGVNRRETIAKKFDR